MLISMMLKKSEVFELFYIYYGFLKRYLKPTRTVYLFIYLFNVDV